MFQDFVRCLYQFVTKWLFIHDHVTMRCRSTGMATNLDDELKCISKLSDFVWLSYKSRKLREIINQSLLSLAICWNKYLNVLSEYRPMRFLAYTWCHKLKMMAAAPELPHILARSWDWIEIPTVLRSPFCIDLVSKSRHYDAMRDKCVFKALL